MGKIKNSQDLRLEILKRKALAAHQEEAIRQYWKQTSSSISFLNINRKILFFLLKRFSLFGKINFRSWMSELLARNKTFLKFQEAVMKFFFRSRFDKFSKNAKSMWDKFTGFFTGRK